MEDPDAETLLSLRKKLQQLGADLSLEHINGVPHIVLKIDDKIPGECIAPPVSDDSND